VDLQSTLYVAYRAFPNTFASYRARTLDPVKRFLAVARAKHAAWTAKPFFRSDKISAK
jgi:hypothetical protein